MTEPDCKLCRGVRWVCEERPGQPMGHDGCRGAGVPCPLCMRLAAGRTTSATAGLQDGCGPEAWPASLTLTVPDQRPARGVGSPGMSPTRVNHKVTFFVASNSWQL